MSLTILNKQKPQIDCLRLNNSESLQNEMYADLEKVVKKEREWYLKFKSQTQLFWKDFLKGKSTCRDSKLASHISER